VNSIVICAYTEDRWQLLQRAVESAESQTDDVDVVLVIDHNDSLLQRSRIEWPQHTIVANEFASGLSGARNTGILASHGEVVAFLDDDAEAAPGWLKSLVAAFDDRAAGGAGGTVQPAWATDAPAWFPPEFGWVVGCSYTGQPTEVTEIRNPIGANMAFRREVFDRVGGFREEIGRIGSLPLGCEETELSIRACADGWSVWLRPDAVVHHFVPAQRASFRYFVRRCYAEGMSKAVVSAMAGHDAGLASERTYVGKALPAGLRREMAALVHGPRRLAALGRAASIVIGVLAASVGFLRASAATRRGHDLQPVPALAARLQPRG
jgi:GT2 family glycosyltransferase